MIIPGTYVVNYISLHTSNVVLKYPYENADPASKGDHQDDSFLKCPQLLVYQQTDTFDMQLHASRYHHLDRTRTLEIELSTGWNEVQSCELHIRAGTAGLRLQTSEAEVAEGAIKILKKSEAGIIQFNSMDSGKTARLRIPFSLEHQVNDIFLKLEISYTTDKGDFFFAINPQMSIMLPLDVNVEDIFKHNVLFSRFSIMSSTTSPIRLLSIKLEDSEAFKADCGTGLTRPLVVFPRQHAIMLYKITKSPSQPDTKLAKLGKEKKAALPLVLHYICLEEEIDNAITQALRQSFEDTQLHPYLRLIIPTVIVELRGHLSPLDLERIAVLSEFSTSVLSDVKWQDRFSGLGHSAESDKDIPTLITRTLEEWQRKNHIIPLIPISLDEATIANSRSIVIPVEVPSVTVVHTADLKLFRKSTILSQTQVVTCNQPIAASLNIKWTRTWDWDSGSHKIADSAAHPAELGFQYEISGLPDTWLIGGRRKGNFRLPANSQDDDGNRTLSFPVVLIPLREGYLPFPHLDIRPSPIPKTLRPGSPDQVGPQVTQPLITCETDYKNAGETLRVISDALKTTVSLDASGPQEGPWLLESERRSRENVQPIVGR
jgi:hypothetical protein